MNKIIRYLRAGLIGASFYPLLFGLFYIGNFFLDVLIIPVNEFNFWVSNGVILSIGCYLIFQICSYFIDRRTLHIIPFHGKPKSQNSDLGRIKE